MSGTATLIKPRQSYGKQEQWQSEYAPSGLINRAIIVERDSAVINPKFMETGKFYLAVINDKPYLYRKEGDKDIEVYGFAG